ARAAFGFLPETWPTMPLDIARARAGDLLRRRAEQQDGATPHARPLPPATEEPPAIQDHRDETLEQSTGGGDPSPDLANEDAAGANPTDDGEVSDSFGAGGEEERAREITQEPDVEPAPPPATIAPAPSPQPAEPPGAVVGGVSRHTAAKRDPVQSAPADATAFAPKKLRRGSPELVRIVIHQPKDLQDVIKAARKIDPRTDAAPSGMKVGDVALGSSVGVSIEVRGATCDGAIQRRTWQGEPLDFNFSAEADGDVKQAVFLARVFVDDAQIGVLAFTRPVGGPKKDAASTGDKVRLKRHKRVFLSYSSKDRETVSAIATAYEAAGVQHFFDRTSLKSGEEWSPRLRQEIDRADLFHLCWSKSAAQSEWVEKEAEHALTRRRRSNGKNPEITVQMLDGPPWAKHPPHLDSINFDDFVRAAIVGYARGDGES
ncbi:MAG: toll/interleukin-1 receptor domain-containing protein, partial [Alphaproteobacteria bacterium]|nr:toll/interleukin-1 receptor domain-containing protein [Alphaproteobacteria bacterium]